MTKSEQKELKTIERYLAAGCWTLPPAAHLRCFAQHPRGAPRRSANGRTPVG
jgi:hypothetical protein